MWDETINYCLINELIVLKQFYKIGAILLLGSVSFSSFSNNGDGDGDGDDKKEVMVSKAKTTESSSDDEGNIEDVTEDKARMHSLRISGFSRLVGYYRKMNESYPNLPDYKGLTYPINLGIGDGSGNPAFMLRLEGSASKNTQVLLELGLHHNFGAWNTGVYAPGAQYKKDGKVATVFSRFALDAKTRNDYGTFRMQAGGGMNWGKLSPFTLWTFQYRDDMFERYPWDPAGSNWKRYNWFYSLGDVPRDLRWGNRSLSGFRIDAEDLPKGFSGTFIFGRTIGIWESWLYDVPQQTIAFRVGKNFKGKHVGINYFNQGGYGGSNKYSAHSLSYGGDGKIDTELTNDWLITQANIVDTNGVAYLENKSSQLVLTTDLRWTIGGKVRLFAEMGIGSYLASNYSPIENYQIDVKLDNTTRNKLSKRFVSPVLYAEADFKKAFVGWPFKLSAFYVGRHAVNNSSAVINSSIETAGNGLGFGGSGTGASELAVNNQFYFEGLMPEIGQITNNRTGVNLQSTKKFGKLVLEFGMGLQQELVNLGASENATLEDGSQVNRQREGRVGNSVTFYHIVNQYQRSRFDYNNRFYGPYKRLMGDFRRSWENIAITDTVVDYKKSYSMMELGAKYKTTFLKKELIISAFGRANSVQEKVAPLPKFGEKAFVRQWYEELMLFYHIAPKWTIVGMFGSEQVKGNLRTELVGEDGEALYRVASEEELGSAESVGHPAGDGQLADLDGNHILEGDELIGINTPGGVVGKAIDQIGFAYGIGFDYDFAANASIDFRYRWIDHKDKNFTKDKFNGHDITLEMKVFF